MSRPLAIVEGEGSFSRICATNPRAHRQGIRKGLHPSRARALVSDIELIPYACLDLEGTTEMLTGLLATHSPRVSCVSAGGFLMEPFSQSTGTVASGEVAFASAVLTTMVDHGFPHSRIGIADTAITAMAAARSAHSRGVEIVPFGSDVTYMAPLPCRVLPLTERMRRTLETLGLMSVGDIQSISLAAFERRLGAEGRKIWMLAQGRDPRLPRHPPLAIEHRVVVPLLEPCVHREPILFILRGALNRLVMAASESEIAIGKVTVRCSRSGAPAVCFDVAPSQPTIEFKLLFVLIQTAFESLNLDDAWEYPIESVELEIGATGPLNPKQGELFSHCWRDPVAAEAVRIRLEQKLGPAVLSTAVENTQLRPAGGFHWAHVAEPEDRSPSPSRHLACMRLMETPVPINALEPGEPPHLFSCDVMNLGASIYRLKRFGEEESLSGAWWDQGYCRRYFWCETLTGQVFWMFYDPELAGWFLHGWLD